MLFVLPFPVCPRRTTEKCFRVFYQLCNVFYIVSFVVLMTEFSVYIQGTLPDYFSASEVSLFRGLEAATQDCDYEGIINVGGVRAAVEVKSSSLTFPLLMFAQYIIALLVVQFMAIIHCLFSFWNYLSRNRHMRVCGVHIPLYHTCVVFSVLYSILLIVLVWVTRPARAFFSDGIRACAERKMAVNSTQLLEAEYTDSNIFLISLELVFAAAIFHLLVNLAATCALIWNSRDRATVLLSEAAVPWESRGVMCETNKAALCIHTTARDSILKEARAAIARGERVRIACSYALMTEADYEAQVEAMRQQFAAHVKEQHFEHLRTHFEGESDLAADGLLWRPQTPAPPPPGEPERRSGGDDFEEDAFADIFEESARDERWWGGPGGSGAEFAAAEGIAQHRRHRRRRHRRQTAVGDAEVFSELSDGRGHAGGGEEMGDGRESRRRRRHQHHLSTHAPEVMGDDLEGRFRNADSFLEDADEL